MRWPRHAFCHLLVLAVAPSFGVSREVWVDTTTCAALQKCQLDRECHTCLTAVGPSAGTGLLLWTLPDLENPSVFFAALENNTECAANSTDEMLGAALAELHTSQPCADEVAIYPDKCALAQHTCFQDQNCRECLAGLHNASSGPSVEFASPPCVATDAELKQILVTTCRSLPGCTLAKETCQASDTCRSCWSTLRDRDPSGAVAECSSGTGKEELDVMVRQCVSGVDLSCTFWRARCEADPACRDCFDAMGSGSSPSAMIAGSTDPSCAATRESASSASALLGAFDSCPLTKVNSCMARITGCVLGNARCAECLVTLNGGIPPGGSDDCAELLGVTGYDVDLACFCPETQVLDAVIVATSAVGSISVLACIAVILLVVAYDDHKKTLRSRIIIGLMASNVLYSLGNSIPPLYLTRNPVDCAYNELTFVLQRWERSLWVCGKFGSVLYELFIIGASTRALMTGAQLSAWTEGTMHFGCAAGAAMAFAAFYIPVSKIDETENRSNMFKALRNNFEHLGPSDDLNDDNTFGALIAFTNSRTHFNDVLQKFLLAWNAFVGLALLMWLIFRWKHLQLHWAWRREMTSTEVLESTDEWGKTRRSHWRDRRRVLDLQRRAYTEVARPLEPYVVVLLIFAIPGIVMTTPWCIKWSAIKVMHVGFAGARNSTGFYNTGDGQVLLCDSICELLLAFRSAATVAVFFSAHRHRREFVNVRETIRRLGRGLRYCLCCQQPSQTPQSELIEVTPAELPPAVLLTDADIELNTQLAEGANGAVWTGTWTGQPGHHVAIKVMSVRAFHDVDMIEDAQRDFITECDMLRRVRHPNVLKFYGAGRTAQGNGFIITELMTRGSLSAVLSDSSQPLDWPVRMSIALQISLGMEYLHAVPIVHRDLKSANIVLDGELTAKVADFGTSRLVSKKIPQVTFCPFTGLAAQVDLEVAKVNTSETEQSVPFRELTMGLLDAKGTMTKGQGTALWMAPEVWRGDENYGSAIDVYSFGIILHNVIPLRLLSARTITNHSWEIATREVPWTEFGDNLTYIEMFERLNMALQNEIRPTVPPAIVAEYPLFTETMQNCWAGDPVDRPTFSSISESLAECRRKFPPKVLFNDFHKAESVHSDEDVPLLRPYEDDGVDDDVLLSI